MILQPKKAIMIQKQWIDKIFHQDPTKRKSWEVRSWNTHMRGTRNRTNEGQFACGAG